MKDDPGEGFSGYPNIRPVLQELCSQRLRGMKEASTVLFLVHGPTQIMGLDGWANIVAVWLACRVLAWKGRKEARNHLGLHTRPRGSRDRHETKGRPAALYWMWRLRTRQQHLDCRPPLHAPANPDRPDW